MKALDALEFGAAFLSSLVSQTVEGGIESMWCSLK